MSVRQSGVLLAIALGVWVGLVAPGARALPRGAQGRAVRGAQRALAELRVEDAERAMRPIAAAHPRDPDVLHSWALVAFHKGEYAAAAERMRASIGAAPATAETDPRPGLLELFDATRGALDGYTTVRSANGRFVVLHQPGADALLVPYALDALARADERLETILGHRMPGPVRLEIYPSAASLARVSTLTEEAIETTGTIALCKWDRLMVTSPRALLRGYPWMDTIAHEYVHLVLTRASRDHAPVWFQEGMAKFLERSWRGEAPSAHLEPAAAGLLHRATQQDRLIAFDRLHPSIALLPSQEDAALAFAQVSTFFEHFHEQHGDDGLRVAVRHVAEGVDAREALSRVAGVPFARLERQWKAGLALRPAPDTDPPHMLTMRFRHGDGDPDESQDVEVVAARRHLRLGDLLWARRRHGGAAVEYGRAHEVAPDDPIVASRLARAALSAGDAEAAVRAIEGVVRRYPDHGPAQAVYGSALIARGDVEEARSAANEALRLNPFDPRPHCVLAAAGSDEVTRTREVDVCRRLGGTPAAPPRGD